MPLGDSITDGSAFPGGYRPELFRLALMNSKRITFAGRKVNGPTNVTVGGTTTRFPRNHEGYSGYTIESAAGRVGINTLVEQALAAAQPHIVLLMIGTNDVNNDVADLPPRIGRLLDQITSLAPDALLVVAKIVPTRTDAKNMRVQSYNDAIPALVQARVAAGKHIVLVDMYAAITAVPNYKTAVLVDELHPNEEGYAVMARTWYAGIATYLP
jgi:lysophospholipase L1-like esterase